MERKLRFIPYSKNFKLFRSRSLNTIVEDQQTIFNMPLHSDDSNRLNTNPSQQTQQTTSNIDIFNSLRIPDAIKDLPKYDGNPRLLHEFITNVEEILLHIRGADTTPQGLILLRAIRNKIDGQANEVLNTYGTSLNWDEIKSNLISHYSDKRSETSLIRDLHNLKQYNKPVERFYSEVIEIQSTLTNNVSIHESEASVIAAKRELFSEMCLNSFLSGLREPMGSTVRAMRPESLAIALDYCIREQNINYLQTKHSRFKPYFKNGDYLKQNHYNPQQFYNNGTHGQFYNSQRYQRTFNNAVNNQSNWQQQQPPHIEYRNNNAVNNQSNWRQQHPPRIEYRNNNAAQRPNNFNRQNWERSQPPPEPMDTSSGFSNVNRNSGRFKSSPSTGFSRVTNRSEINTNEFRNPECKCQHHGNKNSREDYTSLDRYEGHNIDDEQDFRELASSDKRVIWT